MIITHDEIIELRAAAARLLYNDNRNSEDYDKLINFINNVYSENAVDGDDNA